jgi:4'-phosphopantetheinyl transferase
MLPVLEGDDVHVWRIDLACGEAEAHGLLDPGERLRASRFVFARDRVRFERSHAAMRRILGGYLGVDGASLAFASEPNGKPRLAREAGLSFNLSHSGDAALLAVSRGARLGVDLEARGSRARVRDLARSVFTEAESGSLEGLDGAELEGAFLRGWTRKEACLKALGVGLAVEPASFHAGLEADRRHVDLPTPAARERVEVQTLAESGGSLAAVAAAGRLGRVTCREWKA